MPIIHSDVEVDKDTHEFRIKHTWDEGACLRECYESRMSGKEGWIEGKKAKRIASIPRVYFTTDIELRRYLQLRGKDNVEANRILDQWLWKHPDYPILSWSVLQNAVPDA